MVYTSYTQTSSDALSKQFLYKVFGFMGIALAITAVTAAYIAFNPMLLHYIFSSPVVLISFMIGQLLLAVALSALIMRLSFPALVTMYGLYAISVGISIGSLLLVYTPGSVYTAFLACSGMFGTMAAYGYFTNNDLSSVGNLARMGIFGLMIAFGVNFFLHSETTDFILSFIGVGLFLVLTANNMQQLKNLATHAVFQGDQENRVALMGALTLYLSFINLFIMILRLTGRRRD